MRIRTYQHPKLGDRMFGIFCDEDTNRWFVILQIVTEDDRILSVVKEVDQLDPAKLIARSIGYSDAKLTDAIERWDLMVTDPVIQASMVVQEIKNPAVGIDNPDEPETFEDDILGP